jgi:AraC-like DNA-binding protein
MLLRTAPGAAVWPAAMVVWGPGFMSTAHAHHCVQLLLAMQGTLRVRGRREDPWRECGAALVRPDALHAVDARGSTVLIGFIEAETELGAALCARIRGHIAIVEARQVARWRAALGSPISEARVEAWVGRFLLRRRRPVAIDSRVQDVLTYLRRHLGASEGFSLPKLAALAGLSQSRFMHVFTESLGVPLRPYIRWLRVQRAACELMAGANVAMAAHRAGFADAAHLTRTFRRMLGTTPSEIALGKRRARGVSIPSD